VEPLASTIDFNSLLMTLSFFSTATSSTSCSASSRRRVFPTTSRGRTPARIAFACKAVMSFFAFPGVSSASSRWSRFAV
jgi:hypothetical protein